MAFKIRFGYFTSHETQSKALLNNTSVKTQASYLEYSTFVLYQTALTSVH